MRYLRILWFIVAIVFGLLVGLLAGWVVFPPEINAADPASLRADYQTDYVLMTAEIYSGDKDAAAAVAHLQLIDNDNPLRVVQEAIITAQQLSYAPNDMQLLSNLFTAVETWTPPDENPQP